MLMSMELRLAISRICELGACQWSATKGFVAVEKLRTGTSTDHEYSKRGRDRKTSNRAGCVVHPLSSDLFLLRIERDLYLPYAI